MKTIRQGWKILTHDWRSPLQRGEPICDGRLPVTLPPVQLDTGSGECAAGWNYVADIVTGWRIAGLWPMGYPARIVAIEASPDAIVRGNKRRASQLTLVREATAQEVHAALVKFSHPFGEYASRMIQEQTAWQVALARPRHDPVKVEAQLALTLSARALPWGLKRLETIKAARAAQGRAWAARAAWDTWAARAARDAWDARAAQGRAWDAWDAWDTWDARAAWDTRAAQGRAWDVWDAWDAWDAWAARAAQGSAWDAWAALIILYVRLSGWQDGEPEQYTVGIRDAYANGLAFALPVGSATLGWAMEGPMTA